MSIIVVDPSDNRVIDMKTTKDSSSIHLEINVKNSVTNQTKELKIFTEIRDYAKTSLPFNLNIV